MARRWAALVALLDTREDGLTLALVRILVGVTIAAHLAHLTLVGAVDLVWLDAAYGGLRKLGAAPLGWLGAASPGTVHALVAATFVAALAMAAGALTRVSTLATWIGFRLLGDLNNHAGGSYDELLINTLFLLLLADCGARLSVDARLAAARGRPRRRVTAWPRWLMVFQLVVMYSSTALQKVSDHWVPWGSHDALWYILQQPTWQRVPMGWVAPAMPLLSASTVGVWAFESSAPLLLLAFWFRLTRDRPGRLRALFNRYDLRAAYLVVGVLMHAGIEATMEVGAFFPATMALYVACLSPDEWARLGGRLAARLTGLRRVSPPRPRPGPPLPGTSP